MWETKKKIKKCKNHIMITGEASYITDRKCVTVFFLGFYLFAGTRRKNGAGIFP